ncbi:MAG: hypothetical protein FJW27_06760 [Acidimicrobiia bacterium]|nr:hypothetical protein [Acidimicrobiia bacterium]
MARRHTRVGLTLLESAPNLWLRALAENNLLALAIISCDIETGLKHARAGLQAAEMSGAATVRRALIGNLGHLYSLQGSWEDARIQFRETTSGHQATVEAEHGALESLARLYLLEDQLDEARECLDAIDTTQRSETDAAYYVNRHSKLTRAILYIQERKFDDALQQADVVRALANRSGDDILRSLADLTRAEALALQGREAEFGALIDELRPTIARLPIDLLGHYERVIGSALAGRDHGAGASHFARAARTFEALRHRPGQIQLQRASIAAGFELRQWQPIAQLDPIQASHGARVVQDILTMLLHVGRPELLATDVVDVLAATTCVARATAIARHDDGRVESIAAHAMPISASAVSTLPSRTYQLGRAGNRSVEVTCEPLHNVEAIATVNAVASLLEVVRDLDAARTEREERLGL